PVIDVRSQSEFSKGHIPGAGNIPLFDDREREIVGTKYKKEGRRKAILKGLELSGPSMYSKLQEALKRAKDNRLLVHCWRGGMRSEAMAWLFSLGDVETQVLDGGYKAYRHHVLEKLSEKHRYIVLGGLTGCGKTEILNFMKSQGHQVIDLEGIACHKGSAFGSLGQPGQPTSEHFANLLFHELEKTDKNNVIWLEDESKNIGTVYMPDQFYFNLRGSPVIALIMDVETRLPRLIKEYSVHPEKELISSIERIAKRLGGDDSQKAIREVEASNFSSAIEITLNYYDKTYMFGLKRREEEMISYIHTDTDEIEANTAKVLKAAGKIIHFQS
ncbi:MAG: tRNA 2-selenouridine(34) synthase MnmH, partial [Odoribacter sp.]|nr:tRNA 2-selenouridine(34) synthase MnmH [Odoribacter sp.]